MAKRCIDGEHALKHEGRGGQGMQIYLPARKIE
jgi:hypothetical protein